MSYRRSQERNRRLKKLYNETKNLYGAGAWYDEEKGRYIKYSCGGRKYKKYLKKKYQARKHANIKGGYETLRLQENI